MKIAVTGKGGVGKTLLSAFLSQMFADAGYTVTAIDADPDANLAATLGFPNPENIVPISELSDLIEERVGVKPGTSGGFFALNRQSLYGCGWNRDRGPEVCRNALRVRRW